MKQTLLKANVPSHVIRVPELQGVTKVTADYGKLLKSTQLCSQVYNNKNAGRRRYLR